jgi:hypothetical protein
MDWSSTPVQYKTDASFTAPNGVTYDAANSRFFVDLNVANGMVRIPIPSDFVRVIRYDVRVITSANAINLLDVEFELPKRKDKGAE